MTQSNKPAISHNIALLWLGILVPIAAAIIAALIPYGIKLLNPDTDLKYTYEGPIAVKGTYAFSINIVNGGRKLEKNVRLWVPFADFSLKIPKLTKGGRIEFETKDQSHIEFDSTHPYHVTDDSNGDYKIVSVGNLRPNERISLAVLESGSFTPMLPYGLRQLKIASDDTIATFDEPSDVFPIFRDFGALMFIIMFVVIGIYGIYYQFFMSPVKKEELILREIDKLKK